MRLRMHAPRLGLLAGLLVLCAAVVTLAWLRARHRAAAALSTAETARTAPLAATAPLALHPPAAGLSLLTAPAPVFAALNDGRTGRTWAATAGGLLSYAGPAAAPVLYTHLSGLPHLSLRALARLPDHIVIGDSEGGLALLLPGERVAALQLPEGRGKGPILALVPRGEALYILQKDQGVFMLMGDQLTAIGQGRELATATALCASPAGLWVGLQDGRLLGERAGRLAPGGQVEGPILALSCDGGVVYAGTPERLYGLPGTAPVALVPDLSVTALHEDGDEVAMGTLDDGVHRFRREPGALRLRRTAHDLPGQRVHGLSRGGAGLLVATAAGLYRLPPGGPPQPFMPPERRLSGPHVTALSADGEGRLWVGTFEHGIDVVEPGPDLRVTGHRGGGPAADNINALLPYKDVMLAATVRGIDLYGLYGRYEAGGPRHIGTREGLIGEQVQALCAGPFGLAAATNRGLTLLPEGGGPPRSLYTLMGLLSNRLYALAAVGETLYAGTLSGVSVIEKVQVVAGYGTAAGLPAGWVTALAPCGGDLFIGTYGGGVAALGLPRGGLRRLPRAAGAHVSPGALLCDGDSLWIGSLEQGLVRHERTRLLRLDPRLLPARSVTALHRQGGALYVGTEAGLLRLEPARLMASLTLLTEEAEEDR